MKAKHVIPHIQFTQLIKFVLHGAEFSWKVFNTEADVPLLRGLTCGGGGHQFSQSIRDSGKMKTVIIAAVITVVYVRGISGMGTVVRFIMWLF